MKTVLHLTALLVASVALAFDPGSLSEVGLGLGGNAYWSHPVFANALWNGSGWLEYAPGQWGTQVHFEGNPQFDTNGLPQFLNPGRKLRAVVYALHANPGLRPASWPDRTRLARGKVVVTWKGDADIRAEGGVYVQDESSGPPTGSLVDGRRVYRYGGKSHLGSLTVESVNPNRPLTDLKVWLPDPADPMNAALENRCPRLPGIPTGKVRRCCGMFRKQSRNGNAGCRALPPRAAADPMRPGSAAAIDANVKTVWLRRKGPRGGKLQPRVVPARPNGEIDPQFAAMNAVAIQLRIGRTADFARSGMGPPKSRDGVLVRPAARHHFDGRTPGLTMDNEVIRTAGVAKNHPLCGPRPATGLVVGRALCRRILDAVHPATRTL